jgi:tetratricopeptide (TPR) repeat protein
MRTLACLPLALSLLAGCAEHATPAAAAPPEHAPVLDNGGAEPVSNWKDEEKRLAMRGLAYDSGRALIVDAEARHVVPRPDPALADGALAEGRELLERNRALEALGAFTRAVLHDPARGDGYLGLGEAFLLKKMNAQAEAALCTGLERAPASAELTFRVADVTWRRGDRDAATAGFAAAVRLDSAHVAAWQRLMRAHYYAEDDRAAWSALHRVEDLGGDVPPQLRERLASRTPEPLR